MSSATTSPLQDSAIPTVPPFATQLSVYRFRFLEVTGGIDPGAVTEMIRGEWPGCVFRGVATAAECARISRNYKDLTVTTREDGVPGRAIGPFHYKKTLDDYFADVERSAPEVRALFEGTNDPVQQIQEKIATALSKNGYAFRPARHRGRAAGTCVARSWSGTGTYSLLPHEDVAQLLTKAQAGFEIQQVAAHTIVGANLCVQKDCQGTNPKVWNLIPGSPMRAALGLEESGYPYPAEVVDRYESVVGDIQVGDFYMLNSNCIHAVTAQTTPGLRLTLSFLIGQTDDSTVIYWT